MITGLWVIEISLLDDNPPNIPNCGISNIISILISQQNILHRINNLYKEVFSLYAKRSILDIECITPSTSGHY